MTGKGNGEQTRKVKKKNGEEESEEKGGSKWVQRIEMATGKERMQGNKKERKEGR